MPDLPPSPPRNFGTWVLLLAVWAVGLLIWTIYLAVIVMVLFRWIL